MNIIDEGRICLDDFVKYIRCTIIVKYRFSSFRDKDFKYGEYTWEEFMNKFEGCYFYVLKDDSNNDVITLGVSEYVL